MQKWLIVLACWSGWGLSAAGAHEVQYSTVLNGPSEASPNDSPGVGTATVTVDFDLSTMRVQTSFSGLKGNTSAAHIHCCTTTPQGGLIGVATEQPSFTDFPLGVTAGSYDRTYDLALASSYNPAFLTANGGTPAGAMNAFLAGLSEGRAYLNIHSSSFPTGEIRGFLLVPEPTTGGMALLGLAGCLFARRKIVARPDRSE